jgi:Fe2+ or Zn2+ uptake regulation protein
VRETICAWVGAMEESFTAEDAWREVCRIDKGISISSIYRTLADLLGFGLLKEIPCASGQRIFMRAAVEEAAKGLLVCRDCHRVIPLGDECLELRQAAVVRRLGFDPEGMRLRIEASCTERDDEGKCRPRRETGVGGMA